VSASEPAANLPGILTSNTLKDSAEGSVNVSHSSAHTTSTLQNLNLLNGLLRGAGMEGAASANVMEGGAFQFSRSGSRFLTLSVQRYPGINANVPANTVAAIAALGQLYLHRVTKTSHNSQTRMIELVVTQNNKYGLPVEADLQKAVATASLHSNATS
jgi:hypothetical protein